MTSVINRAFKVIALTLMVVLASCGDGRAVPNKTSPTVLPDPTTTASRIADLVTITSSVRDGLTCIEVIEPTERHDYGCQSRFHPAMEYIVNGDSMVSDPRDASTVYGYAVYVFSMDSILQGFTIDADYPDDKYVTGPGYVMVIGPYNQSNDQPYGLQWTAVVETADGHVHDCSALSSGGGGATCEAR